jgi:hypothetical protein
MRGILRQLIRLQPVKTNLEQDDPCDIQEGHCNDDDPEYDQDKAISLYYSMRYIAIPLTSGHHHAKAAGRLLFILNTGSDHLTGEDPLTEDHTHHGC